MDINTEKQAREIIEEWRSLPASVQTRHLRYAIETLELNQMYYEQKGRPDAAGRVSCCLVLMRSRLKEVQDSKV